jgi:hypothetical protein
MIPRLPPPTREPDLIIGGHPCHFVWSRPNILRAWKNPDGTMSAKIDMTTFPTIPRGVIIHHHGDDGDCCSIWLPWVRDDDLPDAPVWTLLSLHPLSLAEPFVCRRCGMVGTVRDGEWWWWHKDVGRLIG